MITQRDKTLVSELSGLLSFERTRIYEEFLRRREKLIAIFTGNQFGKTSGVAHSFVLRALGKHPVREKNMTPGSKVRTYRCASPNLPTDPIGGEVKNTQYPAIKRYLPPYLIKKDITVRRPVLTIGDVQGGPDIHFEFVSYNQEVQTQAGVQRAALWCDESAPASFFEEQKPRLLAADGDIIYSLTPAEMMSWEFDQIFEKAQTYVRTQAIVDRIKLRRCIDIPIIEQTGSEEDIVVLQAATDDNPSLSPQVINNLFDSYDDEDVVDIRRYGLFRQVSGQIFKDFDMRIHKIDGLSYFTDGIPPSNYLHARAIDYHERTPWACLFVAISPQDEVFVYDELNPSPEKLVTLDIAKILLDKSGDSRYGLNVIDPLAVKKQSNTGLSVLDDLNRFFYEFRREGKGTGGYWKSWDTKSTRGRDEIRRRLKNSRIVGKPFMNSGLPTIWFLSNCKQTLLSMKNWRMEEWANREMLMRKDEKEQPQQKWSHFPMCLEALFKESAFRAGASAGIVSRGTVSQYRLGA